MLLLGGVEIIRPQTAKKEMKGKEGRKCFAFLRPGKRRMPSGKTAKENKYFAG